VSARAGVAGVAESSAAQDRDTAVSALFVAHQARLVVLAHMIIGDWAAAEDVVQDAFAALYRRWPWLRDKGAAVGYLQSSVANGSRSRLRRLRTMRASGLERNVDLVADPADAALLRSDEQRTLAAALAQLPVRQRQVIVLRYYLDQSEAEIAGTLSISKGSVKKHASRALAALGSCLEAQ
jgi:RNA polymerase sigma-70 factor (sigma-E family)